MQNQIFTKNRQSWLLAVCCLLNGQLAAQTVSALPQLQRMTQSDVLKLQQHTAEKAGVSVEFRDTFIHNKTLQGPPMVVIPAGEQDLGCSIDDPKCDWAVPRKTVQIRQPFAIGKYELTFGEYELCLKEGACTRAPKDKLAYTANIPVVYLNYAAAKAYTDWLSAKTGHSYFIPSEYQWEHAARGGSRLRFAAFGQCLTLTQANFTPHQLDTDCPTGDAKLVKGGIVPVGRYPQSSPFGLHDTLGNVPEVTADQFNHDDFTLRETATDGTPYVAKRQLSHVTRGGHYGISYSANTVTRRHFVGIDMKERVNSTGVRIARKL